MIGCLGIALIIALLIKPTTWMFLLCGGIFVASIAVEQFQKEPSHGLGEVKTPVSIQVVFWFVTLAVFIITARYMLVPETELYWLLRDLPLFWRYFIPLCLFVALLAQSWPLRHHLTTHHLRGKTEHAEVKTELVAAETILERAEAGKTEGLTPAEKTSLLMLQKGHEEAMRQRKAELDVLYLEKHQELDLEIMRKKGIFEVDLLHAEAVQALELAKARALAKMDIKTQKAIFKMKVDASMRVQLAPDHELLEVYRLMLQNMEDLGSMNKDKKKAADALYEHFTTRFEELRHKKTA